jgi:galactose mutarotase-like enzyme
LSALRTRTGDDLLWDGEPNIWAGRAPLLFPIVGALALGHYRLGSMFYELARHGFARRELFQVIESTAHSATFRLESDRRTEQVYPFPFQLDVRFSVTGLTLDVSASVSNRGDSEMPASLGFHPALRWPLPFGQDRSAHSIVFPNEEPAGIRRLDSTGLLTPRRRVTPVRDRRLLLEDALFAEDVVIFDELVSRSVTYGAKSGPRVAINFPDAPFLGVWSKPGAGFVCIEPWYGIADPAGYAGDFREKPGIFVLAPEQSQSLNMAITLLPGNGSV